MKEWKPIKEFESLYAVSNTGEIMRTGKGGASRVGKIIKSQVDKQGYIRVTLSKDSKPHTKKVHRLVAQAFIGEIPKQYTVNHIDGVKSNNHVTNLEIITRSQNIAHAFRVIRTQSVTGSKNPRAILNEIDVVDIRLQLSNGVSPKEIMQQYPISKYAVSDIKRRKSWIHV